MNPIFVAAAAAGVAAAKKKGGSPQAYAPPRKQTEIQWLVGEDKVEKSCLQALNNEIAQKRYPLKEGESLPVTQVETEKINPKAEKYKSAAKWGALTVAIAASAVVGVPLLVAGALGVATATRAAVQAVKGKKASTHGKRHRPIRSGEVMIRNNEKAQRKELVYKELVGPNGPREDNREPSHIGWLSNSL